MGVGFAGRQPPASGEDGASRLPSSQDCERPGGHAWPRRAECSLFDSDLAATAVDLLTMVVLPVIWRHGNDPAPTRWRWEPNAIGSVAIL
jgi:hypothetical protein